MSVPSVCRFCKTGRNCILLRDHLLYVFEFLTTTEKIAEVTTNLI